MNSRITLQTLAWCAVLAVFSATSSAGTAAVSPEETALSLDGTWRVQPAGAEEREIAVPGFWERSPGLANVRQRFSGEEVELRWRAMLEGKPIAGERRALDIPLGGHTTVDITFTPPSAGELRLELVSVKGGTEQFHDRRAFTVE